MILNSRSIVYCALLTGVIVGCRRGEAPPTPPRAVEFDEGPGLTFTNDATEVHISPADTSPPVPLELADDVPMPRDAKVTLNTRSPEGAFVAYSVASPSQDVRKFYVDEFASGDWELTSHRSSNLTHELAAIKSNRTLHVLIDPTDSTNETSVTLSHNSSSN